MSTSTICSTGHRILARVRSHKKLRMAPEESKPLHRRQHSDPSEETSRSSSTTSGDQRRAHYPPIEFDPLKLNPTVIPSLPPRQHDSFQDRTLRTKRSLGGNDWRRPRFHHSDSGFSVDIHEGFDFGFEREKALERELERNRANEAAVNLKGWPSPASTTDSEGSWFHDSDDDDEEPAKRAAMMFGDAPTPRARPQVGPDNYLKRGGWKRRGIVFGGPTEEVYQKEEDAFGFA